MKLRAKYLGLETGGKPIVILNKEDAEDLGIRSLGRVVLEFGRHKLTSIVDITNKVVSKGSIGVSDTVKDFFKFKDGEEVEVNISSSPSSLQFIINKVKGRKLSYEELLEIVKDVVQGNLSEIEIAAFVTALHLQGIDLDEAASLSKAMVDTGQTLNLSRKLIVDKHSVGGVPGDKTTILVVPIVAAAGLVIPKTSSRAITSAAGTADRAECLMPVNISIEEVKRVVDKTNGCIVWGGSFALAPADDIFIQVEYPLSIDPLLLPSIMAKKKAVGTNFLALDIPTGRGAKIKTIGDADILAKDFIILGKKVGINVQCALTYGEQPIGHAIGSALEAKEALEVLMRLKNERDLIDKATHIAGLIFDMVGKKNGTQLALDILKSGSAEKKLREIIMMQGGDPEIKPEDIEIGSYGVDFESDRDGIVLWINNGGLVDIARAAGSPKYKGAGIILHKKLGDPVKKGEKLFTVYAENDSKLERVSKDLESSRVIGVGTRMEMLIHEVKEIQTPHKRFILER